LRAPAERHPVPIKGVPHGQTSGMQIVSAAEDAYESYGLSASLVVPICVECAEHYAQAANALLRSRDTRLVVGPLVCLLWTHRGRDSSAARLLSDPDPGEVRELILSADRGCETGVSDAGQFYCAALAASGGRIAVRDWTETTISAVERSMARYFRLQRMAASDGTDESPWGVFALAAATVRDAKDIEAWTVDALLRVALFGGRVPPLLLYQALRRAKAGQSFSREQAALIKMALASWVSDVEEERMRGLDPERHDPAYLCGRLLAVLERAQASATSGKATIGDRLYGFASTAPHAVFPRLLRGSQSHLAKMRRGKPGAHAHIQRQLKEILGLLPEFPAVLDLADQGLFALGCYHQRVANWQRAYAPEPGTAERLPVGPLDRPTL
jgi:CRISPR-associated protein Csd1